MSTLCCGRDCAKCEVRNATVVDDVGKKTELSKRWSMFSNKSLSPADVSCKGCRAEFGKGKF